MRVFPCSQWVFRREEGIQSHKDVAVIVSWNMLEIVHRVCPEVKEIEIGGDHKQT